MRVPFYKIQHKIYLFCLIPPWAILLYLVLATQFYSHFLNQRTHFHYRSLSHLIYSSTITFQSSLSECQRMNGIPRLSWFQSTEAVKLTDVAYHLQRWPPSIPCLHVCTCLSLTERWSLFPFPLNLSWTYVYFNQQNAVEMTFWTSKLVS